MYLNFKYFLLILQHISLKVQTMKNLILSALVASTHFSINMEKNRATKASHSLKRYSTLHTIHHS